MKRILYNATILPQDVDRPVVSALVIQDDRILTAGTTTDIFAEFGNYQKQNMGGKFILPGIIDAHIHLENHGVNAQKINCETRTLEKCLQHVSARVKGSKPGEWILGHGWNQNDWHEGFGSASMLDKIAPQNPVYLTAKSLHAGWANGQALKIAGIDASTPDPENGRINHDRSGEPTGILLEDAMLLISLKIPPPTVHTLAEIIKKIQPELWNMGITGVHDFDKGSCFSALKDLHDNGELKVRVLKSIAREDLDEAISTGLRSGSGDDFLRIGSLKLFADGALGPHTAAMFKPFIDDYENYGILTMNKEKISEYGMLAANNGISLAVHAIGDRANNEVLEGFKSLRDYECKNGLKHLRHRIEHVQLLHPADAGRLSELDLIASMQPIHATSDMTMADKTWGDRCSTAYAWKTQLDHGAHLAFGSDAPVDSPNPFLGLHAAVTRQRVDDLPGKAGWYPEQCLSFGEALRAYTEAPAYAAGMEDRSGKLKPGYLADLIVLDRNPFLCHPSELVDLKPAATMVNGDWVFES
jgi:hypothetical protein